MTLRGRRGFIAAAALAVTAFVGVSCGGNNSNPAAPTGGTTGTGGGGAAAADVTITIVGMSGANSYNPSPAAVRVGQTVAWHNADSVGHTATGSGFDTGGIAPGATSSPIVFSSAGTIAYKCSFHPSMTGTLNVTP